MKVPHLPIALAILAGFLPLCLSGEITSHSNRSCKIFIGNSTMSTYAPVDGYVLKNHVGSIQRLPSPKACFLACLIVHSRHGTARCKSVNYYYQDGSQLCELNNVDSRDWPKDLIAQEGTVFLEVSDDKTSPTSFVSCADLKRRGYQTNGSHIVDPDGPGQGETPSEVKCDMSTGATILQHDSEARQLVHGCEAAGCWIHDVTYYQPMEFVLALINASSWCQQFIQYECFSSVLWRRSGEPIGWAVSRDNGRLANWGGVATGTEGCQCQFTEECPGRKCNCDANDDEWRSDEGFLTDSTKLPIVRLQFGDVGGYRENGYVTLGPLTCFGLGEDDYEL
ncbi:contactin-associated protein like 5-3-like [Acanthaster planci]|uniref:Contactin-associated protein like 5-3-like n=1 Tax=Acanthaster planci TaxID=133434 RepID=A0A8B7ZPC2_ACAPL|nr:contactin-associated protein like 5-3-like [Acanthaster planci]